MSSNSTSNHPTHHQGLSLGTDDLSDDDTEADITRYESMPLNEVNEELRRAGIDPARTVEAVKRLIRERLGGRKHGSGEH